MAYTPSSHIGKYNISGGFNEKEFGNRFEYRANDTGMFPEFPHIVYVGPYNMESERYAKVLKTVAYIAVNENADGSPVVEKWFLKDHRKYDRAA